MKKSLVVFLVVALGFLGCATNGKAIQEEEGRFYERFGGFSIMIPDGWEAHESPMLQYKILIGPADNSFTPNINFETEAFVGTTEVYVDAVIAQLKELLDENIEVLQRGDFVTAKDLKGERVVFNTVQGRQFRQILYCFPGKGGKLVATCTVAVESNETYDELFDQTMKTFEWIQ